MDIQTYITVLEDTLCTKEEVLQKIYEATVHQEEYLNFQEIDIDAFEAEMDTKDTLLQKLEELDRGFESIYEKIATALQYQKEAYKAQILEMQERIKRCTDLGVQIQAAEQRNRNRLETYLSKERQEIAKFQSNNRTANLYHQHMANQHQEWQSYFLDRKK